jgi:predicted nucleic acid-binding protein
MKVLFDTNVVLDLLLERKPYLNNAIRLFNLIESKKITAYLGATTVTTIHYLTEKVLTKKQAKLVINNLLSLFKVAAVDKSTLLAGINSNFSDFEDAVLYMAAKKEKLDAIITRDKKGFKEADIEIYSPADYLNLN